MVTSKEDWGLRWNVSYDLLLPVKECYYRLGGSLTG